MEYPKLGMMVSIRTKYPKVTNRNKRSWKRIFDTKNLFNQVFGLLPNWLENHIMVRKRTNYNSVQGEKMKKIKMPSKYTCTIKAKCKI